MRTDSEWRWLREEAVGQFKELLAPSAYLYVGLAAVQFVQARHAAIAALIIEAPR